MSITIPAEVRNADALRRAATRDADVVTLAALLHDDLVYGHSTGVVDTKASYLEGLSSGRVRYRTLDTTIDRAADHEGTVVLHGSMSATLEVEGQTRAIDVVYLSVWRHTADGWQMVAFQSARPPA